MSTHSRRRAWLAVTAGIVLVAALAVALATPDRLHVAGFSDHGSESARTIGLLHGALGYDPQPSLVVLARSPSERLDSPSGRAALSRLAERTARDPAVGKVRTAVGVGSDPALLSRDGHSALLLVHLTEISEDAVAKPLDRLRDRLRQPGLELSFGGYWTGFIDTSRAARDDLVRAELIAFPLLAALLLLVFRGIAAAAIPLAVGGAAVAGTVALLRLLAHVFDVSVFALNLAVLLGLGLAVDYALLMVSRYREEAAARGHGPDAISATVSSAGSTVIFSALAVSAASATLLLFPQPFIYSMGIAGVVVPLLCAAAARVFVPPILTRAGSRIGEARPAGARDRWGRWACFVTRRHVAAAQISVALLIAVAAQALDLETTFADKEAIPRNLESRQVNDTIDRDFTPHLIYPIEVAVRLPPQREAALLELLRLRSGLLANPGVARADAPDQVSREVALLSLTPRYAPFSHTSQALVRDLRALPTPLLVGGPTAELVDLKQSVSERAVLAGLLAAFAVALVLFVMTRSLVLPVKTVVVALLSLGALVGLMVLFFQHGGAGLAGVAGYDGPHALDTASIVVIVAVSLGLAVDYAIVLLARITEEHRAGRSDEDALIAGIRHTGPVITSAAVLLAVALLALATSDIFPVKQLTIGTAIGVLLDATIVRMVLVPSSMRLLGRANWWAPRWLRRGRA